MSDQVADLQTFLKKATSQHSLCFTGRTNQNKPISENTLPGVIRRVVYEGQISGHSFRRQFNTVMNELPWNSGAILAQLARVNTQGM